MSIKRKLNVPWWLYATSTFNMLQRLMFLFEKRAFSVSVSVEYRGAYCEH